MASYAVALQGITILLLALGSWNLLRKIWWLEHMMKETREELYRLKYPVS